MNIIIKKAQNPEHYKIIETLADEIWNDCYISIISKEQKNIQNKLKKVEEKISDLELKIEEFEASFAKENPSEQVLESYNKTKEELDLTLQEWEYLGSQLEA